jgi:cell division protein FtsL
MNAAGRLVHQGILSRHLILIHLLTRRQFVTLALIFAVIFSALATIYVTQATRTLHANYQHNLIDQDRLHVERGQLLLERSIWMMPVRIQHIAESKLNMVVPDHHSVVIIHE